jgi:hypothetical protein
MFAPPSEGEGRPCTMLLTQRIQTAYAIAAEEDPGTWGLASPSLQVVVCPQCGLRGSGDICEYCFTDLAESKTAWRVRWNRTGGPASAGVEPEAPRQLELIRGPASELNSVSPSTPQLASQYGRRAAVLTLQRVLCPTCGFDTSDFACPMCGEPLDEAKLAWAATCSGKPLQPPPAASSPIVSPMPQQQAPPPKPLPRACDARQQPPTSPAPSPTCTGRGDADWDVEIEQERAPAVLVAAVVTNALHGTDRDAGGGGGSARVVLREFWV